MRTITNVTNVLVIDSLSASPPAIIQGSLVQTLFPLYVEFVLYMARTYSSLFINSFFSNFDTRSELSSCQSWVY